MEQPPGLPGGCGNTEVGESSLLFFFLLLSETPILACLGGRVCHGCTYVGPTAASDTGLELHLPFRLARRNTRTGVILGDGAGN